MDLAEYLFRRLYQLDVRSIHGVPGDYNLVALDYIPKAGLKWVGNCNELNAGYAADGYARIKGLSALVTTFGVGELSALNAVAGAYSEQVPLVHIVGTPSTQSQKSGQLLHHTLGNGDFNVFSNMSRDISVAVVKITDPADAPEQIDNALQKCWIESRPVYISLPTDMVQRKVNASRLDTPLDLSIASNDDSESAAIGAILKALYAAKTPVILVDACAIRHRVLEETRALVEKSGLPTFVAPMGKGAIDETLKNFVGVYGGDASDPRVRDSFNQTDMLLSIGALKSDFNTGGFTYRVSQLFTTEFHHNRVQVGYAVYPGLKMKWVLQRLLKELDMSKLAIGAIPTAIEPKSDPGETITHAWLWPRLSSWLKSGDIVVTETGTSNFGIWETCFQNVTGVSQVLWGSIGWSVGALQGAALAASEKGIKRTIGFIGDGSFQLTAQELSTMIRLKLKPIIFLLNNDGYTIERLIHGMEASYNDVQPWKYTQLVEVFGGGKTSQVRTKQELDKVLEEDADCLHFIEVFMPKEDAPLGLKLVAKSSADLNSK